MARTSETEVKNVITTSLEGVEILQFINLANRMVTNQLSGEGMTDALLKDIEMWLAAHLIAVTKERQPSEEKVGDIWIRYQGSFGEGLSQTTYGQMVLTLDSSGNLQRASMKRARIRAIQQDSDDASALQSDLW